MEKYVPFSQLLPGEEFLYKGTAYTKTYVNKALNLGTGDETFCMAHYIVERVPDEDTVDDEQP